MELFMSPKYFLAILIRQPFDIFLRDDCKHLFKCFSAVKLRSTSQLGMEGQGRDTGKSVRLSLEEGLNKDEHLMC